MNVSQIQRTKALNKMITTVSEALGKDYIYLVDKHEKALRREMNKQEKQKAFDMMMQEGGK